MQYNDWWCGSAGSDIVEMESYRKKHLKKVLRVIMFVIVLPGTK